MDNLPDIAIVGMAGRFPNSPTVEDFWKQLCEGKELISRLSDEDLLAAGVSPQQIQVPNYVKAGSVLQDIDKFDAGFFEISPKEAELMDPQHRLFLECAWNSLEHAGYDPETYSGWIGVFGGGNLSTYMLSNLASQQSALNVHISHLLISQDKDYIPSRVSYKLNLKGPSLNVSTACSTSLVAVHLACRSLLNYECDMALAGGVSVTVPHVIGYEYETGGMLSPDGHCRSFDAKAQGTVMGSGVGTVVLKRLKEAIAEGDQIYAVIKGSAINNDGAAKVGFTAPSVEGQTKVIAEAQVVARVDPSSVSYVEAHGTATPLGDPIEFRALKKAFARSSNAQSPNAQSSNIQQTAPAKKFCAMGSVKSNVGHLNSAAGITGLIKTTLALHHKKIPPSLHFEQPNPEMDLENSPFYVNTQLAEWENKGVTPRRAGVSSFGFGGTNAHVVLEEAPPQVPSGISRPAQLLTISARTPEALDQATHNLAEHLQQNLQQNTGQSLADVAYTLHVGRRDFDYRRMVVCTESSSAVDLLAEVSPIAEVRSPTPAVTFLLPGQGSQYVNMAQGLYQQEPIFREQVDRCADLLLPHLKVDLRKLLYSDTSKTELNKTAYAQPALFVIEYALAQLWQAWGIQPKALVGHSIGEYVAAALAGVFSLEEALALVAARGKLMQSLPAGDMLAVPLSEADITLHLGQHLSIAAINGDTNCVVSGPASAIASLENQLSQQGIDTRRLHTSHAFHSEMMNPILSPFLQKVQKVQLSPPKIPFISNVTGTWITDAEACNPHYWANHLRKPVRWAASITALSQQPDAVLLEVGPGRTLSTLTRRQLGTQSERLLLTSLRHPKEQQPDIEHLLTTLGRLWLAGVRVNWPDFYQHEQRHRLALPTYPFERQRYWIEAGEPQPTPHNKTKTSEQKQTLSNWFYLPTWKPSLLPPQDVCTQETSQPWLLFISATGVGNQLAQRLSQVGEQVIKVQKGEGFSQSSLDTYCLDPEDPQNFVKLWERLKELEQVPQKIVYAWSLATATNQSLADFLMMVQALGKQPITAQRHLWLITQQAQSVCASETLNPSQASLLGLCHVIPQEYRHITCRAVDVVLPQNENWPEAWQAEQFTEQLITELLAMSADIRVAYRDRTRWVQAFEPTPLSPPPNTKNLLKAQGTYLLTEGLSGLSVHLATHLAQAAQAKLVFLEPVFPSPNQYADWLSTHPEGDRTSRQIHHIHTLQSLGAEVIVITAPLTDTAKLSQSLKTANVENIHGVIHTLIPTTQTLFSPIQEVQTADLQQQFETHTHTIKALDSLLQHHSPDFCFILSSLASVLGGVGLAAYSAGHALSNALVTEHNRTHAQPWQILTLDRLQTEEPLPDNAITPSQDLATTPWQTMKQALAITPPEAIDIFQRMLWQKPLTTTLISTTDLAEKCDRTFNPAPRKTPLTKAGVHYARPSLTTAYAPPEQPLELKIAEIWQNLLAIEKVGIHDNFFELGGDSLIATQLASRLQASFPVELPLRELLIKTLTIAKQADMLENLLIEKLEQLSDDEAEQLLSQLEDSTAETKEETEEGTTEETAETKTASIETAITC